MNWMDAFCFPEECRAAINLPKSQLLQQPDVTVSEARLLRGTEIRSIVNFANISRTQGNVASFENEQISFEGIAFIQITIADEAFQKMAEPAARLIHKLIPHHCVVVMQSESGNKNRMSLAKKRISKNSPDLRVVENEYFTENIDIAETEFLKSLNFAKSDKLNQKMYYDYLIQCLHALQNISLTGSFKLRPLYVSENLIQIQKEIKRKEAEIEQQKKLLNKDTQMAERVAVNTEIHRLKKEIEKLQIQAEKEI